MQVFSGSLPGGNTRLIDPRPKVERPRVSALGTRPQVAGNFRPKAESKAPARAADSQIAAFAALVRPFERAIYLVGLAFVYNPEEAVDVAQETVFRAFRSIAELTHAQQFRSWLIGIGVSEARTFLREIEHQDCDDVFVEDETDKLEFAPGPLSNWESIPADAMGQRHTRDTLSEALGRLPRKLRVVLFLRDVLSLTTTETAKLIGVSEQTIRTRLARARFAMCGDLGQPSNSIPTASLIT
jgi:RNA polymerase sigma-70 factor, ECF subfamily